MWRSRELPVLTSVVGKLDEPNGRASVEDIVAATGLTETEVGQALRNLAQATPPYLAGVETASTDYPIIGLFSA